MILNVDPGNQRCRYAGGSRGPPLLAVSALYEAWTLARSWHGRGFEKASSLIARGEIGHPVERMMRDCRVTTP